MAIKMKVYLYIFFLIAFFMAILPQQTLAANKVLTLKIHKNIYNQFKPLKVILSGRYNSYPVDSTDATGTASGDYYNFATTCTDEWTSCSGLSLWVKSTEKYAHDGTVFYWNVTDITLTGNTTVYLEPNPSDSKKARFRNSTADPDKMLAISSTNVDSLTNPSSGNNPNPTPPADPANDPADDPAAKPAPEPIEFGLNETVVVDPTLALTKGCGTNGKYTSGILKGVSCIGATKTKEEVVQVIKNIIEDFLLPIVGVLFITVIVLGGLVYISSGGNEESVKRAKKILTAGVVGFLIVTLSYTLIKIFATIVGGGIV